MDYATAQQVENIMRHVSAKIDEAIRIVMDTCPPDESHQFRRIAGQLMGSIHLDISQPIYAEYPDLTPLELRRVGKDYSVRD